MPPRNMVFNREKGYDIKRLLHVFHALHQPVAATRKLRKRSPWRFFLYTVAML